MRLKLPATAAVITTIVFLPSAAQAVCKQGICVSGKDVGNLHVVTWSTTLRNVDHYNFKSGPGEGQDEVGRNVASHTVYIGRSRPRTIHYAIQACAGGGVLQKSSCSPWATFTHTAK
jgi:hypothetical protein